MTVALALMLALQSPQDAALAPIDKAFVCPESLPDAEKRMTALHDFMDAVARAAPDKSVPDALVYRRRLLQSHGCEQTLKNLDAAGAAVARGDVQDQAWFPLDSGLPDTKLAISTSYLTLYTDARLKGRAVETYIRVDLTRPGQADATHTVYDQRVSHVVYYCQTNAYALIETDDFLAGKPVRQAKSPAAAAGPPPLYATTPIPPGSLDAIAAHWACGATHGKSPAD